MNQNLAVQYTVKTLEGLNYHPDQIERIKKAMIVNINDKENIEYNAKKSGFGKQRMYISDHIRVTFSQMESSAIGFKFGVNEVGACLIKLVTSKKQISEGDPKDIIYYFPTFTQGKSSKPYNDSQFIRELVGYGFKPKTNYLLKDMGDLLFQIEV